jgi:hypothetical protein
MSVPCTFPAPPTAAGAPCGAGRRPGPPHLIRLAFFHRHDGEQHLASLPPALPTKSRRTGERTGRPRDALAELPWDKLRLSAVLPRLLCGHRRRRRRRLAGQTQQCQPDASWATMDLKAQGLRRSPAAPTARPQAGSRSRPRRRRRGRAWPTSGPLNAPARPTHGWHAGAARARKIATTPTTLDWRAQ